VGDTDVAAGKAALAQAGPGADVDAIHVHLVPVRAAAVAAGTTAGLSEKDFALFRAVVSAVDATDAGATLLDDGTTSLPEAVIVKFQTAVTAVHKRCD
jgi:hypothetical protein